MLSAALLAAAVFGCAGANGPAVASIGGAGSACALPVTFDVAKPWKAKRTEPVNDNSSWFHFSHVCKIEAGTGEAKVTLSVYTSNGPVGDSPQKVMDSFQGAGLANYGEYTSEYHYNKSKVASNPALEMDYRMSPPDLQIKPSRHRRLAVVTPKGTVVLSADGSESPASRAFKLAKSSMKVTPS
ncbi:lipoprotein [Streptomyces inhibens]|uniref:lipoprotein n=1 Tax=Streptomyces inhibens TaxID=2293571 RepID=UPI0037AE9C99